MTTDLNHGNTRRKKNLGKRKITMLPSKRQLPTCAIEVSESLMTVHKKEVEGKSRAFAG